MLTLSEVYQIIADGVGDREDSSGCIFSLKIRKAFEFRKALEFKLHIIYYLCNQAQWLFFMSLFPHWSSFSRGQFWEQWHVRRGCLTIFLSAVFFRTEFPPPAAFPNASKQNTQSFGRPEWECLAQMANLLDSWQHFELEHLVQAPWHCSLCTGFAAFLLSKAITSCCVRVIGHISDKCASVTTGMQCD